MTKKKSKVCLQFGEQVRRFRRELDFSQESFADAVGIHRTYIGAIERGEKSPSLKRIYRISRVLNIPLAKLFTF